MEIAVGAMEFNSIASGIETTDAMLKAGDVSLDFAKPVCPGKFIVMIHGEVAAVQAGLKAGQNTATHVVNSLIIPRVHRTLIPAINSVLAPPDLSALGVVEYFDICSAITGADTAAKSAQVQLTEVRLGMGIAGKSFFKCCGQVSDVRNAVRNALDLAKEAGTLVSSCVIPSPNKALFLEMM
jgi:microcompartment protein CcmL/EutN